uniref:Sideroflexin 4 n=1 Tax=Pelusios castaneus TaxID=367368 RepID=A0A8C8VMI0_9SAUR
MDPNLAFWAAEGTSFFQRLRHWTNILDPTFVLKTQNDIERVRMLLLSSDRTVKEPVQNKQVKEARNISLSSVNSGTGEIIPLFLRPSAFLPLAAPLFYVSFIQSRGQQRAFFGQLMFHAYATSFTMANGNVATKAEETEVFKRKLLWNTGAISYAAFMGTFPNFILSKQRLPTPSLHMFFRKILPIPSLAYLSAINVFIARSTEYENGIEVMDKNGNVVGVSKKAGLKAVGETALSRGTLLGATLLIPDSIVYLIQRTNYSIKNPRALAMLRMMLTFTTLGVLLPVSFSLFPQLGEIKRNELEKEILSSTEETELFYNRGI